MSDQEERVEVRLQKLRERLKGTYDLDDAKDCQRVIQVLLRGSDKANRDMNRFREDLRALAVDVLGDKYDAKDKAERAYAATAEEKPKERGAAGVMGFLNKMSEEMAKAEGLSDRRLYEGIMSGLWSNLGMNSRDSAMLGELMRRFKDGKREADGSD